MLTIIIKNDGEENVIKLTYENLWREIKDMPGADIIVADHWLDALDAVTNKFVCFVEADCLVSSGFFSSQMGLLQKNPFFRKIAIMSSATAVEHWGNKFYGYSLGNNYANGVIPNKESKSRQPYPVQIAYLPGSIVRMGMLSQFLSDNKATNGWETDLPRFSTTLSLGLWKQGDGNRIHLNPNATYCTTEKYVNDIGKFEVKDPGMLVEMFRKESI